MRVHSTAKIPARSLASSCGATSNIPGSVRPGISFNNGIPVLPEWIMARSQIMMTFGIVHSLVTAGQPLGGPRFKHKSAPLSGWAVDYVVDSLNQRVGRSGCGGKEIMRITSKFAECFKGLGVLRQAQDSEQGLRVVVLWKRFEAGDFLVEFSNVKALLG